MQRAMACFLPGRSMLYPYVRSVPARFLQCPEGRRSFTSEAALCGGQRCDRSRIRRQVGSMSSGANDPNPNIERRRVRQLSETSGGRVCPRCDKPTLVRVRCPFYLRWLRWVGVDVRTYRCSMCSQEVLVRGGRADDAREVRSRYSGHRTASRLRRRVVTLGVMTIIALGALASFQVLSARSQLVAGSRELSDASALLHPAARLRDTTVPHELRAKLVQAEGNFGDARSNLWLWSPLLDRLGWVPHYGSQLEAASPAADTAYYTTRSAVELVDGLMPAWLALAHPRGRGRLLRQLAPLLEAGHGRFLASTDDADRAARALQRLPRRTGNGALDNASARVRSTLPGLRVGSRWLAVAPVVLGTGTPSHYLIILQNPAELRATGGFIGAADYVTLRDGAMRSAFVGSTLPHEIDSVSAPLPETLYTAESTWLFRDSNWSPDFPLSARLARWFYGEDTGNWSNGVIGLVDTGIRRFLGVTGPIYVGAFHQWVDAGNVDRLAEQYVHGSYHGSSRAGTSDTVRKQFLARVAAVLLNRIQSMPPDRWPALTQALGEAAAAREIQVYDRRPAVESTIRMSATDGGLRSGPGDFLAVVDDNRSYNKINPFIHEWAQYQVDIRPDLGLEVKLAIHYYNAPSPSSLDGAGPFFGLLAGKHEYQDFVRVFVPAGAQLTAVSGVDKWAPAPAYGLTQLAGRFLLQEGRRKTVTFRYRLPANVFSHDHFKQYVLTVRHQPGGNLRSVRVVVRGMNGVSIGSGPATRVARVLQVHRDVRLELPVSSGTQPRVRSLPGQTGPVDPYVPFSYMHDPRHPL
jgi:Protein of unknown function (DUF4012)